MVVTRFVAANITMISTTLVVFQIVILCTISCVPIVPERSMEAAMRQLISAEVLIAMCPRNFHKGWAVLVHVHIVRAGDAPLKK